MRLSHSNTIVVRRTDSQPRSEFLEGNQTAEANHPSVILHFTGSGFTETRFFIAASLSSSRSPR